MLLEFLLRLDYRLLFLLNVRWANPGLDPLWLTVTQLHKQAWFVTIVFPLLLFALFYTYRMQALKILMVTGLAAGISDTLAYRGVKSQVKRQRPFQNQEISAQVRKVGEAHGPSFPSNHAANVFAGAVILAWYIPRLWIIFYSFALLAAVSRVVLGVHYPSDVIAGAILGILVALLIRVTLLNRWKWLWLDQDVPESDTQSAGWRARIRRLNEH
ncbi:MAG: phosphatase PAP2 family protein [Bdellovibrionales bacterium]